MKIWFQIFSFSFLKRTRRARHFALLDVRIGPRSSENGSKTYFTWPPCWFPSSRRRKPSIPSMATMWNTFSTRSPSSGNRFELPDQENDRAGEYFQKNKTKKHDINISTPKFGENMHFRRRHLLAIMKDFKGKSSKMHIIPRYRACHVDSGFLNPQYRLRVA